MNVRVVERVETLKEVGAGLQLSANAMQVMDVLGLTQHIVKSGFCPHHALTRHYKTGRVELSVPLGADHQARYGQPYVHIHRADLLAILEQAARARSINIDTGVSAQSYTHEANSITLKAVKNGQAGTMTADILIGADGIHSAVRQTMLGPDPARFTGQLAWRGLVPTQAIPANTLSPNANLWLGPYGHFVAYYVRGGTMISFVAIQERDVWTSESWSQKGDKPTLQHAFSRWDPVVRTLINGCDAPFLWGLFDRPELSHWVDGRAVIMGDAAHPMLPFMAQGAAMAIEDAWTLASCIFRDGHKGLSVFEQERKARATQVQNISRGNAKLFHYANPASRAWRKTQFSVATLIPRLKNYKFDPIYGHNVVDMQQLPANDHD